MHPPPSPGKFQKRPFVPQSAVARRTKPGRKSILLTFLGVALVYYRYFLYTSQAARARIPASWRGRYIIADGDREPPRQLRLEQHQAQTPARGTVGTRAVPEVAGGATGGLGWAAALDALWRHGACWTTSTRAVEAAVVGGVDFGGGRRPSNRVGQSTCSRPCSR